MTELAYVPFCARRVFREVLTDSKTITRKDAFIITATLIVRVVPEIDRASALLELVAEYEGRELV